jgi:hypothetical protein
MEHADLSTDWRCCCAKGVYLSKRENRGDSQPAIPFVEVMLILLGAAYSVTADKAE